MADNLRMATELSAARVHLGLGQVSEEHLGAECGEDEADQTAAAAQLQHASALPSDVGLGVRVSRDSMRPACCVGHSLFS